MTGIFSVDNDNWTISHLIDIKATKQDCFQPTLLTVLQLHATMQKLYDKHLAGQHGTKNDARKILSY